MSTPIWKLDVRVGEVAEVDGFILKAGVTVQTPPGSVSVWFMPAVQKCRVTFVGTGEEFDTSVWLYKDTVIDPNTGFFVWHLLVSGIVTP